jgi:bacterioferritin-associated ferredoxin
MIVCSCNVIARREIEAVIEEILVDDSYAVLTPGLLYHRLGRRGKCGGCFPHVSRILVDHGDVVRARIAAGTAPEPASTDEPCSDAA